MKESILNARGLTPAAEATEDMENAEGDVEVGTTIIDTISQPGEGKRPDTKEPTDRKSVV